MAHGKLANESPTLPTVCEGLLVRTGNYGTYCNSKLFGEETHCGSIILSDDSIYALWVVAYGRFDCVAKNMSDAAHDWTW